MALVLHHSHSRSLVFRLHGAKHGRLLEVETLANDAFRTADIRLNWVIFAAFCVSRCMRYLPFANSSEIADMAVDGVSL